MKTAQKNQTLNSLAELIRQNKDEIIRQNKIDVENCGDIDASLLDRLKVDEKKVMAMIASVKEVMAIEDPEGRVLYKYAHPQGMDIENRVVPFGRILIIYESRPDVTIEAAISAFKAGNKILLKGGKEARNTNTFLVKLWKEALSKNGIDSDFVSYLDLNRGETQALIKGNAQKIDLIIPRGGEGLINFVTQNSNIPVIVSGRGNNFLYVDAEADFEMATELILNGKSRLSVCNALDKVLFNSSLLGFPVKLASLVKKVQAMEIDIYADEEILHLQPDLHEIPHESMFGEEFLTAKILFSMVAGLDEAIEVINKWSGGHSAVIASSNSEHASQFQQEVDCAAVYHNASTRFTDGGQFGFGAEIAISTQKLHFRGPVGLSQLVTNKWFISGTGQIRA